ncbi:MAG TPA: amidohydrolase family protein [Acidobacteriota bacterium]|nr:amidohydrolase family protein [Acidobacteriota bacterium]
MKDWNRREFLKVPLLGATAVPLFRPQSYSEFDEWPDGAVDVNVTLFRWPFRQMHWDDTDEMADGLRQFGVNRAWAGSFEALFHRDIGAVNLRLARECRKRGNGLFVPFGTVNPMLPDWSEDLRRCHEEHNMPGIRLYPGYHGYPLDHPSSIELLEAAAERDLLVQIVLVMEDPRTAHPLVNMVPVAIDVLDSILGSLPDLKIMLLNAARNVLVQAIPMFVSHKDIYCDISWLDGLQGVERLVTEIPTRQVLFGSHSPFFYFEASWLKMKESILDRKTMEALVKENAKRIV